MSPRVMVIGAGVTGLVAAHELGKVRGADGQPRFDITVLESSDRMGGQIRTVDVDGARVDVGAEAAHLGAPHVAALVRELGIGESAIGAEDGSSVLVTRKGAIPLPEGVGPTGPTKLWPVLTSGILTLPGIVRAGLEPITARRHQSDDLGVGEFTRRRFGREVTDTFVDPLLGNLHGGDVHQLSLHATAPQLVATAANGESMVWKNLRNALPGGKAKAAPAPTQPRRATTEKPLPMFANWPGGLSTFTDALAKGSRVRLNSRVKGVDRSPTGWYLTLADGQVLEAEHVLFTTPGPDTARLLKDIAPQTAAALDQVRTASVATVLLGYDKQAAATSRILREHNGVLVPNRYVRTMKAATNLGRKWPHLGSTHHLVRASVGRSDNDLATSLSDEQLIRRVGEEFGDFVGLDAEPAFGAVYRWPEAMPQLAPGHLERMRVAREEVAALHGLHLAGSSVDGLGIGGTVKSGQRAAAEIVAATASAPTVSPTASSTTVTTFEDAQ